MPIRWASLALETWLTVLVILATIAGALGITYAIGSIHPPVAHVVRVTPPVVLRSITRLLDERFSTARLQAMWDLGTTSKPQPVNVPASELASLGLPAGALGGTAGSGTISFLGQSLAGAGGDSLFVVTMQRATPSLARSIARLVDNAALDRLEVPCASASREGCLSGNDTDNAVIEKIVEHVDPARVAAALQTWTEGVRDELAAARSSKLPPGQLDVNIVAALLGRAPEAPGIASSKGNRPAPGMVKAAVPDFTKASTALRADVGRQLARDVLLAALPPAEASAQTSDLVARLAWGTSAIVFVGLWMAAAAVAFRQIWVYMGKAGTVASLAVMAAIGGLMFFAQSVSPTSFETLGQLLRLREAEHGTSVIFAARILNGLATSGMFLLLAAATAVVTGLGGAPGAVAAAKAANASVPTFNIRERLDGLRLIFNSGAALLVAGTLMLATLYGWPASDFDEAGTFKTAAWLAAGYAGSLCSVVLMLVYLPTTSALRDTARAVLGDADAKTLLADAGLDNTSSQQLARLIQALAPLLTAVPLSALAEFLAK